MKRFLKKKRYQKRKKNTIGTPGQENTAESKRHDRTSSSRDGSHTPLQETNWPGLEVRKGNQHDMKDEFQVASGGCGEERRLDPSRSRGPSSGRGRGRRPPPSPSESSLGSRRRMATGPSGGRNTLQEWTWRVREAWTLVPWTLTLRAQAPARFFCSGRMKRFIHKKG